MNYVSKYCKSFVKCSQMHMTFQMLTLYGCMMEELRSVHHPFRSPPTPIPLSLLFWLQSPWC